MTNFNSYVKLPEGYHSIPQQFIPQGAVLHQDEEERHKGTEFRPSGELQPAVFVLHDVGMV